MLNTDEYMKTIIGDTYTRRITVINNINKKEDGITANNAEKFENIEDIENMEEMEEIE